MTRSFRSLPLRLLAIGAILCCATSGRLVAGPTDGPPLRILLITGGGYHDYKTLVPFLTNQLAARMPVHFKVEDGLDVLRDRRFADAFDAVLYDLCFDEAADDVLDNAIQAVQGGKPAIMVHCAVHAFRKSPRIRDWETCCGMRSKVHDRYGPFTVENLGPNHPITRLFPRDWKTPGDELYQTIAIDPNSRPLLKVKSPQDGREHVVAWTYQHGKGRVFSTTLGHDMKTTSTPEYLQLLTDGIQWACGRLVTLDASPAPAPAAK